MNTLFFKSASVLLNIVAFALAGSLLSARAETIPQQASETVETLPAISEAIATSHQSDATTTAINKGLDSLKTLNSAVKFLPEPSEQVANFQEVNQSASSTAKEPEKKDLNTSVSQNVPPSSVKPTDLQNPTATNVEQQVSTVSALDSTPLNSASALNNELTIPKQLEIAAETSESEVAQINITPGRPTRSGSSYVGVAGNIGFNGDSRLGSSSFAIISKIGLTNNLSVRPAALIGDDPAFLIPVTFDFQPETLGEEDTINFAPYAGAGIAISTGDESRLGFLLSGGVDVPISTQFTATAGLNIGFLRDTEFGLLIGVGYNFPGFGSR